MESGKNVRQVLLQVISQMSNGGGAGLQVSSALHEAARQVRADKLAFNEQEILTAWADLFREGLLAPGYNLDNPGLPWFHLTGRGRAALTHVSRDPSNPAGYDAYVKSIGATDEIALSYLREAVQTYNAQCFKAAAVMVGAASERLVLALRDALTERLTTLGRAGGKDLRDWRIKPVLNAVEVEFSSHAKAMPVRLRESFEARWPAYIQQIRSARNDAGHPSALEPVTPETVHASLLIFPDLLRLQIELVEWLPSMT